MSADAPEYDDVRMDIRALVAAVWRRLWRIALVTLLALAAAYGILMFQPRLYESGASILVESRENAFTRAASDAVSSAGAANDPGLMSSQIELIKSRDTLLKVVESEKLRDVPEFNGTADRPSPLAMLLRLIGRSGESPSSSPADEQRIIDNLLDRLSVVQERDSRLISILVRSEDRELAARLANAIAAAHVARRADLSIADTAEATVWLEQEIDKLRVRVSEAEAAVAAYRVENDLFTGGNNTSLLDQQMSNLTTQISAAQERKNAAQSRATLIRGLLDAGQPVDGVPDVRESTVVQQLTEEKARLQGERAQLLATLLPNHPNVRAVDAQVAEIDAQIVAEGRRVAAALNAEADIEAGIEQSLREDLARLKVSASTATQDNVRLAELEREAAAQRALLETYLLRYRDAASRTESSSALPDVRVVTLAAPSNTPASPQTAMILLAVGLSSVVLQVGGIIASELASGRALVSRQRLPLPTGLADKARLALRDNEAEAAQRPPAATPIAAPDRHAPEAVEAAPGDDAATALADIERADRAAMRLYRAPVAAAMSGEAFANLAADLALGRARIVYLAGLHSDAQARALSDRLVAEARSREISVVRIDAGSGRLSPEAGLTDLVARAAGFGDVVHKQAGSLYASVPWGQRAVLDRRSTRPATLVEALSDIYEVVLVLTGRLGVASSLPMFAHVPGRLVLVADAGSSAQQRDAAMADLKLLGFPDVEVIGAGADEAEVA